MAKGVNKWIGVGNLGADPEQRSTGSGTAVTTIRLAVSESWKDKQTGEAQERTEWIRCKAFGRLAEIIGEYARKGRQVYVEGKIRTEKYEKDGVDHFSTDIIIDEFQLLGVDPNRERAPQGQGAEQQRPANGNGHGNNGHQGQNASGRGNGHSNGNGGHSNGNTPQRGNAGNGGGRNYPPPPPQRNAPSNDGWDQSGEVPF